MAVRGVRKKNNYSPVKYNADSLIALAREKGFVEGDLLNITKLIEEMGLVLVPQSLPPYISGELQKVNGQWAIIVNKTHSINRQRYTIAHELGHYCLHKDFKDMFQDTTFFRREKDWTSIEYEANSFAANLLMPKDAIESAIDNDVITLKELSDKFGVSMVAMKNRLLSLNYKLVGDE